VLTLRYFHYQSDVYIGIADFYHPIRGLAVLGEGCQGVLDSKGRGAFSFCAGFQQRANPALIRRSFDAKDEIVLVNEFPPIFSARGSVANSPNPRER
jgi:hypothetical protein